jgi:hypothetical protein
MYNNRDLTQDEKDKANEEQAAILAQFEKVSQDAPIRRDEDYNAIERRRQKRAGLQ